MVERKVFKTKLCVLYQKGRCPRQNCSFAHGNAELRHSFASFNVGSAIYWTRQCCPYYLPLDIVEDFLNEDIMQIYGSYFLKKAILFACDVGSSLYLNMAKENLLCSLCVFYRIAQPEDGFCQLFLFHPTVIFEPFSESYMVKFLFLFIIERINSWHLWIWEPDTNTVHYYVTSFNPCDGNLDRRSGDLRDKLDRRLSPRHKYSPERDRRGWRTFHGSSPSRSFQKNGDKKRKKTEHFDEHSDFSGSLRGSDGAGDQVKRRKSVSTDSRIVLKKQIKEVQSEIIILDQKKSHLRSLLKEKDQETDVLTARIQELDAQLSKEKEEGKRIISKIKKFVKAHKRYVRVKEELQKSQIRLQKLGDELGSGTNIVGDNEEDSSINIVSDGTPGSHAIFLRDGAFDNSSLVEKSMRSKHDGAEELRKGDNFSDMLYGIFQPSAFLTSPQEFACYVVHDVKETENTK